MWFISGNWSTKTCLRFRNAVFKLDMKHSIKLTDLHANQQLLYITNITNVKLSQKKRRQVFCSKGGAILQYYDLWRNVVD